MEVVGSGSAQKPRFRGEGPHPGRRRVSTNVRHRTWQAGGRGRQPIERGRKSDSAGKAQRMVRRTMSQRMKGETPQ